MLHLLKIAQLEIEYIQMRHLFIHLAFVGFRNLSPIMRSMSFRHTGAGRAGLPLQGNRKISLGSSDIENPRPEREPL